MTIIVTDQERHPIPQNELPQLALWNDTLSHVCATALHRLQQDTSPAVADTH